MRLFQFKTIFGFSIVLMLSLLAFVVWAAVNLYQKQVVLEAQEFSKYTTRLASRVAIDSPSFRETGTIEPQLYTDKKIGYLVGYANLQLLFANAPTLAELAPNRIIAFGLDFTSWLKLPNYILVQRIPSDAGEDVFAFSQIKQSNEGPFLLIERVQPAIAVTLICILVLVLTATFHIARVNASVADFEVWANQMQAGKHTAPPNFSSTKLNYMAHAIGKSLAGVTEALEKEQSFAKFTSHELRTPIAVLSANMELLDLIKKDLSPRERTLLENMDSAISDMKYQMEALLWITTEAESDNQPTACNVSKLVEKSVQDNSYLAEGRNIKIECIGEGVSIVTHPVLLQIVVNNLVRNAFQNTYSGNVYINVSETCLVVTNSSADIPVEQKAMGFGLGTVIIEKLVKKLHYDYRVEPIVGGRSVTLGFAKTQ